MPILRAFECAGVIKRHSHNRPLTFSTHLATYLGDLLRVVCKPVCAVLGIYVLFSGLIRILRGLAAANEAGSLVSSPCDVDVLSLVAIKVSLVIYIFHVLGYWQKWDGAVCLNVGSWDSKGRLGG